LQRDATPLQDDDDAFEFAVTIASAETIGKDQTAEMDHPDHQLVTRYAQNHELAEVAIFVGQ